MPLPLRKPSTQRFPATLLNLATIESIYRTLDKRSFSFLSFFYTSAIPTDDSSRFSSFTAPRHTVPSAGHPTLQRSITASTFLSLTHTIRHYSATSARAACKHNAHAFIHFFCSLHSNGARFSTHIPFLLV